MSIKAHWQEEIGQSGRVQGKDFGLIRIDGLDTEIRKNEFKFSSVQRGKEAGMKLTRYEQEAVVNLNASEENATLYSSNPIWIRKMDAFVKEFPDVFRLKRQTEISRIYEFPKKYVRIGKPRKLSIAQRDHLEKKRGGR